MIDSSASSAKRASLAWTESALIARADLGRNVRRVLPEAAMSVLMASLLAMDNVKSVVSWSIARRLIVAILAALSVKTGTT